MHNGNHGGHAGHGGGHHLGLLMFGMILLRTSIGKFVALCLMLMLLWG